MDDEVSKCLRLKRQRGTSSQLICQVPSQHKFCHDNCPSWREEMWRKSCSKDRRKVSDHLTRGWFMQSRAEGTGEGWRRVVLLGLGKFQWKLRVVAAELNLLSHDSCLSQGLQLGPAACWDNVTSDGTIRDPMDWLVWDSDAGALVSWRKSFSAL